MTSDVTTLEVIAPLKPVYFTNGKNVISLTTKPMISYRMLWRRKRSDIINELQIGDKVPVNATNELHASISLPRLRFPLPYMM